MRTRFSAATAILLAVLIATPGFAQSRSFPGRPDSTAAATSTYDQGEYLNTWGVDILISTNGFGLGGFYRREFTPDVFGFVSFSVSEAKDAREIEQYDIYGNSTVPGKLNRFLVLPLMFGVQYRLFREDIVDTFRPYVNAAVGPTMVYMSPFVDLVPQPDGSIQVNDVEFFHSLGRGTPHYTASAYIGFGANFGGPNSGVFGINFRYYFTYLLGDGLPSLYDTNTGLLSATKKDFGGFFITLNVGLGY
ncbi:MAG TPA: hypothetical protein VML00_11145 [Bacteroidota bacterium]|nr:hypothetical protein [Bacteroidota bacterium]